LVYYPEMLKLTDLVAARRGHFQLESGYHGSMWMDLEGLIDSPEQIGELVAELAERLRRYAPTAVCGPVTGGAAVARSLGVRLGVASYAAVQEVRSEATGLFTARYSIDVSGRSTLADARVALVDDVISAGSSVRAAHDALVSLGATVCVVGTLLTLGNRGRNHFVALGIPVEALEAEDYEMWTPQDCPRCVAGMPFDDPSPTETRERS
jgi:orotate phosphoribosyltransferase